MISDEEVVVVGLGCCFHAGSECHVDGTESGLANKNADGIADGVWDAILLGCCCVCWWYCCSHQ